MTAITAIRRSLMGIACLSLLFAATVHCRAQDRENLESPVYRVERDDATGQRVALVDPNPPAKDVLPAPPAKQVLDEVPGPAPAPGHPLDTALDQATIARDLIRATIDDYECIVVKQEAIDGELLPREFIAAKVRNRKTENGEIKVPFGVYLNFLRPSSMKGREVVFIEGKNNEKMMAHEGGFKGRLLPSVWLNPNGALAMRGNRYPVTELGVENLCVRLLERAPQMISRETCEVEMIPGAKLNGRICTCFQVIHPIQVAGVVAHKIQVFHDDEYNIPVHYAAYDFPREGESQGQVLESYTYLNVKLNVGLTDADFDPENPNYNF